MVDTWSFEVSCCMFGWTPFCFIFRQLFFMFAKLLTALVIWYLSNFSSTMFYTNLWASREKDFVCLSKTIKKWELCVEKDGHVASVLLFVLGPCCFSRSCFVVLWIAGDVLFSFLLSCYMSVCWASVGSWNGSIQTKQVAR